MIVDAQIHLWHTVRRGAEPHLPTSFAAREVLAAMDGAGVDAAVLIPPLWEAQGNGPAIRAAAANPERLGVMARPWTREPPRQIPEPSQPILGYRLVATMAPFRQQLISGAADDFWRSAERRSAPVMVFAAGLLPLIDRIAVRHPDLRLIIDCLGLPRNARSDELGDFIEAVVRLARRPNIAVKASALPCYSVQTYPFYDLHQIIHRVLEAYGHRRVFWGSDLTRLPCTYAEALDLVRDALDLTVEERQWILGRGLTEWLGWEIRGTRSH